MKDIHSHILYGIDDGSRDLDESITILKKLEKNNITDLVLTPHYIIGSKYDCDNKKKKEILDKLQKNTSIKLYLGNEIYIDNDILKYINEDKISSINGTKYILVEFPLSRKLSCVEELIFNLRNNDYIPIIAHPERYHYFTIDDLIKLVDLGCLFQGNITSLIGKYGRDAKNNLELLLKKQMISVLGTDTHRDFDYGIDEALLKLEKLVDSNYYNDLVEDNFDKIINNKNVPKYKIKTTKTFFRKEKIR